MQASRRTLAVAVLAPASDGAMRVLLGGNRKAWKSKGPAKAHTRNAPSTTRNAMAPLGDLAAAHAMRTHPEQRATSLSDGRLNSREPNQRATANSASQADPIYRAAENPAGELLTSTVGAVLAC